MRAQRQKEAIFEELERESSLKGISIELSREAGKFTKEVEVPEEYKRHEHIFDPVESKKLPPSVMNDLLLLVVGHKVSRGEF